MEKDKQKRIWTSNNISIEAEGENSITFHVLREREKKTTRKKVTGKRKNWNNHLKRNFSFLSVSLSYTHIVNGNFAHTQQTFGCALENIQQKSSQSYVDWLRWWESDYTRFWCVFYVVNFNIRSDFWLLLEVWCFSLEVISTICALEIGTLQSMSLFSRGDNGNCDSIELLRRSGGMEIF